MRLRRLNDERLLQGFGEYLVLELGRTERTAQNYRTFLTLLARFTGKALADIDANDLRRFKRVSDYAPSSKQAVVVAMRRFHAWGALESFWKLNGIMAVPTPRVETEPKARLSLASTRLLLASAYRPLELRVVFLGLYAGTRIAESAGMDERNVQGDKLVFKGKGRKTRTVPIHPKLAERMDEILSFVPRSPGVLHSTFKRVRDRARVLDEAGDVPTSHTLRRTFACHLYDDNETPYEVVATILGHKLGVTNRAYAPVSFPKMRAEVLKIDYFRGLPVQGSLF